MQYIAFDSHKRYTCAVVENQSGQRIMEKKIEHRKGELCAFLSQCEPCSPVALELVLYSVQRKNDKASKVISYTT
jgi:hypothetical protein